MIHIKQLYQNTKNLDLLYVEDDEHLRMQMGAMFSELFKVVDLAEDGASGLEKFQKRIDADQKPYDLVITDVNMPKMNGIDLIKAIYDITPMQPVVVMSAHNETNYLLDLLHIGVNSFLLKPTQHNVMINTLYTITKAIINEQIVQSHYQEVEQLNAELALKSEALKRSNEELQQKNIALEKSMRIIEGLHHKEQLQRAEPIMTTESVQPDISDQQTTQPQETDEKHGPLENVDEIISTIALTYRYKGIDDQSFKQLSGAITAYNATLPDDTRHGSLKKALKQLSTTVAVRPECSKTEELERIFTMLESFFFIYRKWEEKWSDIGEKAFEEFSRSMLDEIGMLINVWQCKV